MEWWQIEQFIFSENGPLSRPAIVGVLIGLTPFAIAYFAVTFPRKVKRAYKKKFGPPLHINDFRVHVTKRGILCEWGDQGFWRMPWQALHAVVAQVTDRGGDVVHPSLRFWLLYVAPLGSSSFTLVPWGCPGEDKLSDHLQTLPDFNHREFLEAKFCTEKQSFLCWQRPIHTQSP